MFNKKTFSQVLQITDIGEAEIAKLLGIDTALLTKKINGESVFFRSEIIKIGNYLRKKLIEQIFFCSEGYENATNYKEAS